MAKDNTILFSLAALALLAGGGYAVYTATRGLRDNNPGNIEGTDSSGWQGQVVPGGDLPYLQFQSPEYGIRAMAVTLGTYNSSYGLNTITGIVSRWAPPSENNTAAYIASVASQMGVDPNATLNMADPGTIASLISAIIVQENGVNPYDAGTLQNGIALA
jgi:hypothetical protein